MKMWLLAVMAVVGLMGTGCRRPGSAAPDPVYKGVPRSAWIAKTKDLDGGTRRAGYEALLQMGGNAGLVAAAINDPDANVAMVAMEAMADQPQAAPQIVARMKRIAEEQPRYIVDPRFAVLCKRYGNTAAEVAPLVYGGIYKVGTENADAAREVAKYLSQPPER